MFLIILLSVFVVQTFVGFIVFGWVNAHKLVKPRNIGIEREIEYIKERGLWRDFDKYDKTDYKIEGEGGYILNSSFVSTEHTRGTGKYVIVAHGHTSCRFGSVKYVNSYIKLGYSCIIYDSRGHGENVPDHCTLGNIESKDLMKVIADTRKRYPDLKVLGIHGESMGSSSALIATKFNPEIDFIVVDCPNMGAYEVIWNCYSNIHLQWLSPFVWIVGKIVYNVNCKDSDAYRDMVGKCPVLFIHGAGDTFIKPYHSEKLYEKAKKNGAYTELVMVEGAGHANCCKIAGFETYTGYIENFLKNIGL